MIGTPTNVSRKAAPMSPENRPNQAAKVNNDMNWRTREKVKFKDIGFDEGVVPENPFVNVRDVSELPIRGISSRENLRKEGPADLEKSDNGPLYSFVAPVQKLGTVNELVNKILDSDISVKASDLLSAAKPVREELKFRVTQQRVNTGNQAKSTQVRAQLETVELKSDAIDVHSLPKVTWQKKTEMTNSGEQVSAFVVGDVVLQYLETLAPDETPKQVVVAKDSQSLRSIYPLLNGRIHVECLIDSGSQIVSVSQDKAEKSGLIWNPDIVIYMQSANKALEKSLGLARNVPFIFGDMTVLLQVHVIKEPAYDLLLGRPFDTLLQTQIQNFTDGRQTITLTEPMTNRRLTIPTFARGTAAILANSSKLEQPTENVTPKPVAQDFLITSRN